MNRTAAPDRNEILSQCAAFAIRRSSRLISQLYDEHLQATGLRSTQFTVLAMLSGGRQMTMTDLSHELVVSPSTLSRNLRPLTRDGYLDIGRGQGRFKTVKLTARGQRAWQDALPGWRGGHERFLEVCGKGEWVKLSESLERLIARLRAAHDSAGTPDR